MRIDRSSELAFQVVVRSANEAKDLGHLSAGHDYRMTGLRRPDPAGAWSGHRMSKHAFDSGFACRVAFSLSYQKTWRAMLSMDLAAARAGVEPLRSDWEKITCDPI